ncbi:MAG: UDP-2,3-diacylglucosamine diphosphatase [Verrucomicrobiota bacterium]
MNVETVLLSDVPLGTPDARSEELTSFLRGIRCTRIVLKGDIIDGGSWKRGFFWRRSHTRCLQELLRKRDEEGVELIYLRGNHDDFLDAVMPVQFGSLHIAEEYRHWTPQGEYLVLHGDGFGPGRFWLTLMGSVLYELVLRGDRLLHAYQRWQGHLYGSYGKYLHRSQFAQAQLAQFEETLAGVAAKRGCRGVICGHIHIPADRQIGEVRYMNSGDWIHSLTAVVEETPGKFRLISYAEFQRE